MCVHFLDFVQGVGYGFFVNCEETVLRDMFLPPFFFLLMIEFDEGSWKNIVSN